MISEGNWKSYLFLDFPVGLYSIAHHLIMADHTVEAIMHKHIVSIPAEMGQEDVGKIVKKYDLLAVPIVTEQKLPTGNYYSG